MNPDIMQKWVAALRSGKFKQGRNWLSTHGSWSKGGKLVSEEQKFCCLGVLCEVAVAEGIIPPGIRGEMCVQYGGRNDYLPLLVSQWAGLADTDQKTLARRNDILEKDAIGALERHTYNFSAIADYIERGFKDEPVVFEALGASPE